MAFSYTGGAVGTTTGATSVSVTHGLTINSGDLVVAYVNRNDSTTISNDAGGAAWTEALQETPPTSETASHALFWKVAGGLEPSTYTWSLNATSAAQVIVKVFTSSSDAEVDLAASASKESTSSANVIIDAIDGRVISDDSLSVVFGGKDRSSSANNYNNATPTSYVGELGDAVGRITAGAHRIYTTGETFSGNVSIAPASAGSADSTYNMHISFLESSGAFTLTADTAAYTVTGTAAALEAAFQLAGDSGSYTYSGTNADLTTGYSLAADSGSYSYSGTAASLEFGAVVGANSGAYTYSGTAADLNRGYYVAGDSGSYSYSGTDANLNFAGAGAFTLDADTGSYTYTGTVAGVEAGYLVSADSGVYTYTGTNADISRQVTLTASTGSYTYTGTSIVFARTFNIEAESGTYTYTGADVILPLTGRAWIIQGDAATTWSAQSDSSDVWTEQPDTNTTWS